MRQTPPYSELVRDLVWTRRARRRWKYAAVAAWLQLAVWIIIAIVGVLFVC